MLSITDVPNDVFVTRSGRPYSVNSTSITGETRHSVSIGEKRRCSSASMTSAPPSLVLMIPTEKEEFIDDRERGSKRIKLESLEILDSKLEENLENRLLNEKDSTTPASERCAVLSSTSDTSTSTEMSPDDPQEAIVLRNVADDSTPALSGEPDTEKLPTTINGEAISEEPEAVTVLCSSSAEELVPKVIYDVLPDQTPNVALPESMQAVTSPLSAPSEDVSDLSTVSTIADPRPLVQSFEISPLPLQPIIDRPTTTFKPMPRFTPNLKSLHRVHISSPLARFQYVPPYPLASRSESSKTVIRIPDVSRVSAISQPVYTALEIHVIEILAKLGREALLVETERRALAVEGLLALSRCEHANTAAAVPWPGHQSDPEEEYELWNDENAGLVKRYCRPRYLVPPSP